MMEATCLHRQVHPGFVQLGRITSQVFTPTSKDNGKLSCYDGDMISPHDAWEHYTNEGHPSAGVMSVTVGECANLELPATADPEPFPEHVLVSFEALSKGQIAKAAKQLRAYAQERGWQYQQP